MMLLRNVTACAVFFASSALAALGDNGKSHPVNPAELTAAIARADRVVVYSGMPVMSMDGGKAPQPILYSTSASDDISELNRAIAIEPPGEWFRCACAPVVDVVLLRKGNKIGVISIYSGLMLGFTHWSGDTRVADKERLLRWFDARGIRSPREEIEREEAEERASREAEERWEKAMPASLRASWTELMRDARWWSWPPDAIAASVKALGPELEKEFPEKSTRIRLLLGWFGSGAGPWSGFPVYEEVVEGLLLEYQTPDLLAAVEHASLTEAETEGAARLFAAWTFNQRRPADNALIPAQLKKLLLEHSLKSSDEDKIIRARHAFENSEVQPKQP